VLLPTTTNSMLASAACRSAMAAFGTSPRARRSGANPVGPIAGGSTLLASQTDGRSSSPHVRHRPSRRHRHLRRYGGRGRTGGCGRVAAPVPRPTDREGENVCQDDPRPVAPGRWIIRTRPRIGCTALLLQHHLPVLGSTGTCPATTRNIGGRVAPVDNQPDCGVLWEPAAQEVWRFVGKGVASCGGSGSCRSREINGLRQLSRGVLWDKLIESSNSFANSSPHKTPHFRIRLESGRHRKWEPFTTSSLRRESKAH